jgi:hypothetical protein
MTALLHWRAKPEGPIEPLRTNWSTVPANDNADPTELSNMRVERSWRMTPSVEEIMAQVATGDVERNEAGQIIRIGRLRFSDGSQTERAYTTGPDGKVIQYDARMPAGAMLGERDKADSTLGGSGQTAKSTMHSNSYFAEMLDVDYPTSKRGGKCKKGRSYSADESRAMLADAIANTPNMPPVKKYAPGLPSAGPLVADSFVGMKKGKTGESGSIGWEDIATSIVNREIWDAALTEIRRGTAKTLDAAMGAQNLHAVGSSLGHKGRSARRHGKAALLAANDDLRRALKRIAS